LPHTAWLLTESWMSMRGVYSKVPGANLRVEPSPDPCAVFSSHESSHLLGIPVLHTARSRLAIVATLLAFGASMAGLLFKWAPSLDRVALDMEEASEVPGFALMFQQCGGEAWTGPNCCEPGCACVMDTTKFYSQCIPPLGMAECNTEAATDEVTSAQRKKDVWQPLAATRAKSAKLAAENVTSAMDALAKARMARDEAERRGEVLIAKDKKAQGEQVHTRKNAEKAAAFRAKKVAANSTLAKKVGMLIKENALLDAGKCADIFQQCGGANFNSGGACCLKGCRCVFKDSYYSQCEAHQGDGFCDAKQVESQEQALFAKAKQMRREAAHAVRLHIAAHKTAASAKERASNAAKVAKHARIALAQAESKFALKKQAASLASRLAADAKALAQQADLQSAIWTEAVIAWNRAKDKDACRLPCNNGSSQGTSKEATGNGEPLAKEQDKEEEKETSSKSDNSQATIVDSEDVANIAGEEGSTSAVSDADAEAGRSASDDRVGSSSRLHSDENADLRFLMKRLSELYPQRGSRVS